jgi:DNA-binding transcriptional MerR regulator
MAEYRIDDLARAGGVLVRNVRYYQDSGMLPQPRRRGRVAIYRDAHLARLRLITRLLNRGYTAANIVEQHRPAFAALQPAARMSRLRGPR